MTENPMSWSRSPPPVTIFSRQAKTDFIMLGPEQEVYEPGRYSEDPLSSKLWIFRGFDNVKRLHQKLFKSSLTIWMPGKVEHFASCILSLYSIWSNCSDVMPKSHFSTSENPLIKHAWNEGASILFSPQTWILIKN